MSSTRRLAEKPLYTRCCRSIVAYLHCVCCCYRAGTLENEVNHDWHRGGLEGRLAGRLAGRRWIIIDDWWMPGRRAGRTSLLSTTGSNSIEDGKRGGCGPVVVVFGVNKLLIYGIFVCSVWSSIWSWVDLLGGC